MRGVHLARYFTVAGVDGPVAAPITSFLWAGCGYGGSCLPKDAKALSAHSAAHGQPMELLDAVIATNEAQPERMIETLRRQVPMLDGVPVTVLGIAFKEDTDDIRESPALPLVRALVAAGASVTVYDPLVRAVPAGVFPDGVQHAASLEAAVEGCGPCCWSRGGPSSHACRRSWRGWPRRRSSSTAAG